MKKSARYEFFKKMLENYDPEEIDKWGEENLPGLREFMETVNETVTASEDSEGLRTFDCEYLTVKEQPKQSGRKTSVFKAINKKSGVVIAEIRWHGAWRQYCLFISGDTIWSSGCLSEMNDVMSKLNVL